MPLVLAIEPDRRQAAQLTAIVRHRVGAELILADTTERALGAIGSRVPDLVLVPALLSPQDDAALAAALRVIAAAAHVQMLTIPLLAAQRPRKRSRSGMLSSLLGGRRAESTPAEGCDPGVFADQISSYLQRAAEERAEEQAGFDDLADDDLADLDGARAATPVAPVAGAGEPPEPAIQEDAAPVEASAAPVEASVVPLEARVEDQPEPELPAAVEEPPVSLGIEEMPPVVVVQHEPIEPAPIGPPEPAPIVEWPAPAEMSILDAGASEEQPLALEPQPVVEPPSPEAKAAEPAEPVLHEEAEPVLDAVQVEIPPAVSMALEGLPPDLASEWADESQNIDLTAVLEETTRAKHVPARADARPWHDEPATREPQQPVEARRLAAEPKDFFQTVEEFEAALEGLPRIEVVDATEAGQAEDWGEPVESVPPVSLGAWRAWPPIDGIEAEAPADPLEAEFAIGTSADVPVELVAATVPATEEAPARPAIVDVVPRSATPRPEPRRPLRSSEHPQWVELVESLRRDVERLRTERAKPAAAAKGAPKRDEAGAAQSASKPKRRPKKPRPIQDEWGFFDPEQCGFAALLAKLDEITEADDPPARRPS
jgi:hypothetical protein